jgi:ribA/ribD-fused uncharacterized protein
MEHDQTPPVFFKNQEFMDFVNSSDKQITTLTPYEVCKAVEKAVGNGHVDGAQNIRGIWRIYLKSMCKRIELLVRRELRIRDAKLTLFEQNPAITNQSSPDDIREKVIVRDIPLSVSNDEIVKFIESKKIKLASGVKYARERDPNGKLTDFKNGDRYMYCEGAINPLPRVVNIAGLKCRIFHNAQFNRKCRACDGHGHKAGDDNCPARNDEENTTCFSGHLFPLSNFYPCKLTALGKTWKSLEHSYQWWRADKMGMAELADQIENAQHAGVAKALSKDIVTEKEDQYAKISMMKHLIHLKADQVDIFHSTLLGSKRYIAEATTDLFWGCGLRSHIAQVTKSTYWPGRNMLGSILMERREKIQNRQEAYNNVSSVCPEAELTSNGEPLTQTLSTPTSNRTMDVRDDSDSDVPRVHPANAADIIQPESQEITSTPRPRGRPRKRGLTHHDRHHSWGGTADRSGTRTPSVVSYWASIATEGAKRKHPSGTPPKESDNKMTRSDMPT